MHVSLTRVGDRINTYLKNKVDKPNLLPVFVGELEVLIFLVLQSRNLV